MINFLAPINFTSYGLTGFNLCKALSNMGVDYSLFPLPMTSAVQIERAEDKGFLIDAINRAKLFDSQAPCVRLWHQYEQACFVGNGPKIAYVIFELDRLTEAEIHHLSRVDHVIVPTEWAAKIVRENANTAVSVVPLGVDTNLFAPKPSPERQKYVFLCIGKAEKRKGHDILPLIFNTAFGDTDNVELWVMWDSFFPMPPDMQKEYTDRFTNSALRNKIKFIQRKERTEDLVDVINAADCIISPSRAEGWNLPLLEGMACNKPIITTNYSGHTEFCNDNNAFLVHITDTEPAIDNRWFFGQGNWAHISNNEILQFARHMRYVYNNQIKTNHAGVKTARKYTWTKAANRLLEVCKNIPYQPSKC